MRWPATVSPFCPAASSECPTTGAFDGSRDASSVRSPALDSQAVNGFPEASFQWYAGGQSLRRRSQPGSHVILDVEATPTRISKEVDATETMIERTQERFALKPKRLAGDVAYGTGEMLGWLVAHDCEPAWNIDPLAGVIGVQY